jgi:hypothetical protein
VLVYLGSIKMQAIKDDSKTAKAGSLDGAVASGSI